MTSIHAEAFTQSSIIVQIELHMKTHIHTNVVRGSAGVLIFIFLNNNQGRPHMYILLKASSLQKVKLISVL